MINDILGLMALIIIAFLCGVVLAATTDTAAEQKFKTCIEAGIDKTECVEILKPTCGEK